MKCWWHKWGKWDEPRTFGYTLYQQRACLKCGLIEQRDAGWDRDPPKQQKHATLKVIK